MSDFFPEKFCEKVFDVLHNSSPSQGSGKQINKRDFFISTCQILKGSVTSKARHLHMLATSNGRVTTEELLELCKVFIESYTKAVKKSGSTYAHTGTNVDANTRLAKMLLNSIPKDKCQSDGITLTSNDLENWMRNEVLLIRLFEDIFKACFFGPECIVETQPHGLQEGCKPTVEHIEKR